MVTSDWSDVTALVDEMIGHYHLNADQSEALKQCAGMFKPGSSPTPITLIHGMTIYYTIFGSKSTQEVVASIMMATSHVISDQCETSSHLHRSYISAYNSAGNNFISGVFGAGKSYLLTVIVLFLVKLFQLQGPGGNSTRPPQKLLISSTTNVAVDRILMG